MIAMKFFRSRFVHVLIVLVVGSIAYANTFHVPFLFDDKHYIVNNPAIRDFRFFADPSLIRSLGGVASNIKSAFFTRLLGNFTFALNYRIDGLNVSGYHLFNLAIHLLNASLLYIFMLFTFKTPFLSRTSGESSRERDLAALFAALIFVSHPIQTQAVTYVCQRFVPLATFFSLLTFAGYAGFRSAKSSLRSYALYTCSLLTMACAMVSKEISFTIPLLLALYEYLFYPGPLKKRLLCLLPFGLTMFIIPLALLASKGSMAGFGSLGASMSSLASSPPMTRWEYLFTQFRVIVTYIRLFFFPVNQNLDYDYPIFHSFFSPQVFLSFLFLLALFGVAVYLVYRSGSQERGTRNEERGSELETQKPKPESENLVFPSRLIAFGIVWFFVTLSLESSIIPIFDVIFEHRLYLPSIGLIMALVTLLFSLAQRFRTDARNPLHGLIAVLIVVVGIFTGAAYARNRVWGDEERFWSDVVNKSPLKARPHNYLGTTYFKKQRFEEASAEYLKAIALNPRYAVAQFNLCLLKAQLGNAGEAVTACTAAIDLDPSFGPAHDQLGILYGQQGRYDESLTEFRTALRINPDDAVAVRNMGIAVGLRNRGVTK
jgi:hypothetical protein